LRVYLGEHADAIERFERAIRLSPLDLLASTFYAGMSQALVFAGRYDEAASWARKGSLHKPDWAVPARVEAIAFALSGRVAEAREALARMRAIDPGLRMSNLGPKRGVGSGWRRAEDHALYIEGLRRAGLPE
jgi:tetratricopeptide (TPR) repeat protein